MEKLYESELQFDHSIIAPIAHSVMDGIHYRMYVEHVKDVYQLHVSDTLIRRCTAGQLPNLVKEAIAFANVFPFPLWHWGNVYENHHSPELDMIGWRTNWICHRLVMKLRCGPDPVAYIIVVPRTFLEELCG
jgi:hypothetical protein